MRGPSAIIELTARGGKSAGGETVTLYAKRWRWVEAVVADPRLTAIEVCIGIALTRHMHIAPGVQHGQMWPSVATLARNVGPPPGETTVRRALRHYRELGYLQVVGTGGGRTTTRYLLAMPETDALAASGTSALTASGTSAPPPTAPHPCRQRHLTPAASGTPALPLAADTPAASGTSPLPPAAPKSKRRKSAKETDEGTDTLVEPSDVCVQAPSDLLFEEMWSALSPHRPGDPKRAARQAFDKLVRGGLDPALLIERARVYVDNIQELDPRYRMNTERWLREECWSDATQLRIEGKGVMAALRQVFLRGDGPLQEAPVADPPRASPSAPTNDEWREICRAYKAAGELSRYWLREHGLPPWNKGTRVPEDIRKEFGFA